MKAVQICFTLRHNISYAVSWNDCNIEINLVLLQMTFVSLYKLWILFWVERWVETGKKKPWQVKPIKMCIKARSFKAMRSSQWCTMQLLCSLWHISSDLELFSNTSCLVNVYLSLITWMRDESTNMKLKLALGHGQGDSCCEKSRHHIWQSANTQSRAGSLQLPLPDG